MSAALVRSYLFVPGTRPDLMAKAADGDSDAIILDLEDAVAVSSKAAARDVIRDWLAVPPPKPCWIRVNSTDELAADLAAVANVRTNVAGVLLAKAGNPEQVAAAAAIGLPVGLYIETAAAVLDIRQLVALTGVATVHLGEVDLSADAGLSPGPADEELAWARAEVVFACAAAGLAPPPAPVSTVIDDINRFRISTERARRQGFLGRVCIHPRQVTVANEVFTPSPDELERAAALLAAYDAAAAQGVGVLTIDGRMVDEAVLRAARRTLELGRSAAGTGANPDA